MGSDLPARGRVRYQLPSGQAGALAERPRECASAGDYGHGDSDIEAYDRIRAQHGQESKPGDYDLAEGDGHGRDAVEAGDAGAEAGAGDRAASEEGREGGLIPGGRDQLLRGDVSQPVRALGRNPSSPQIPQLSTREYYKDTVHEGLVTGVWEPLPESVAKRLDRQAQSLVADTRESLLVQDRTGLLEIACSPDSILTATMRRLAKTDLAADRCSLWNGCDLGTTDGIRRVISQIDRLNPRHVWMSPICSPFSVMQNVNQRTPEQQDALRVKRQEAMKQYVGLLCS